MNNLLVSCILTTYNRGSLIKRSLESIINQTYKNIEILIVDDCSPDNTKEVIKGYSDSRIKYLRNKTNKGLAQARNTGMENSTGEFIAFLDDDDEWLPEKIEKQLEIFKNSNLTNLGMVSCGIRRINGEDIIEQKEEHRGNLIDKMIIDQPLVGNGSCVMIKKEMYDKYGGFDTRYKRGIDGYYFTKVARYYEIDFAEQILVNYYEDASDRITGFQNLEKVKQALKGEFLLLDNIKDLIDKYPKEKTRLNYRIGNYYAILGEYKNATRYYYKSVGKYLTLRNYILLALYALFPSFITNKLRYKRGLE